MHDRSSRHPVPGGTAAAALLAAGSLTALAALPAAAATLEDYEITGVQFINEDCSRNEYVVNGTVTGTTDDGGGFDRLSFQVWDDGVLKDSREREVAVGSTVDLTAFLSFVGLYGTGAPGVGIIIEDITASGSDGYLALEDPFFPEDVDGPCTFDVERIGGADRVATSVLLSQQKFVRADTVMIATAADYPDALTAAPWAAQQGAPLLLSRPDGLPGSVVTELQRLAPSRVVVLGGAGALSEQVVTDAEAALPSATVDRVGGSTRYATAGLIAQEVVQDSSAEVYVASGEDFPDALVLSALAAREQAPLVLVKETAVPSATSAALAALDYDSLVAAGGTGVISDAVLTEAADGVPVTRYAGADRYATAEQILEQFPAEGTVLVATGQEFPDSLTAVPVAARTDAGVALTRPDSVPAGILDEIDRLISGSAFPLITIVGGEAAVHPSVQAQLEALFGGAADPADRPAGTSTESNVPTE
ncbi:cell wall-binding repeat-containing protein [Ornithinimicrobium flavum]|uniref:cell wall-binding repeat-containing protein n=1 Tax=Ornithinimicrobium flavum TaxID=1288636 RepID=UPI001070431E|nr:cell wall-binding repeat-containing protein [Ornithinimicrobium flavum]